MSSSRTVVEGGRRGRSSVTISPARIKNQALPDKDDHAQLQEYEDLVDPQVIVHAFYVEYLLPIYFGVQSLERPSRRAGAVTCVG
jgi:hypothetical protein